LKRKERLVESVLFREHDGYRKWWTPGLDS
jgi:hypothetical protein